MEQTNGFAVRGTWYIAILEHMEFENMERGRHIFCCMILMNFELQK
jgi:hypothetical protein